MLPDFRVVIVAVISTFLFTASVGFYTSSRLMNEPRKARSESLAALEDSPINRIALNWPEPVQQLKQFDLDFAVSLNGSRNPVRDVTSELETQADLKRSPDKRTAAVDTTPAEPAAVPEKQAAAPEAPAVKAEPAQDAANTAPDKPAATTPESPEQQTPATVSDATPLPQEAATAPAEEPASVQAVRDIVAPSERELVPPTSGLPLAIEGAEAIVASTPPPAEGLATTALTMATPPKTDTPAIESRPARTEQTEQGEEVVETKPEPQADPLTTGSIAIREEDTPLPLARPKFKIPIVITKQAKRPAKTAQKRRIRPAPAKQQQQETPLIFPFNLFAGQPNQTTPAATKQTR